MNRRTFVMTGLSTIPLLGADQFAETVQIGTRDFGLRALPKPVVLREELGIVCPGSVNGRLVHRSRKQNLFECRATITPRGDYLLMFPEGQHYNAARNEKRVNDLIALRSSDRGKSWSRPSVAFGPDMNHHGFIPLIPRGTKRIYSFGTQPIIGRMKGNENYPIGFRYSDDDGHSWTEPNLIRPENDPGYQGMSVMRMCETEQGTWLLGTHEADWQIKPLRTRLYLLRSTDKGKTWHLIPGKRPGGWFAKGFDRMDEGRPVCLGGGKVLFMMRTPEGHLWSTHSADDGLTWEDPKPTTLIHPDAPPMIFLLSDGKTLAAFHHNRCSPKTLDSNSHMPQDKHDRSEVWVSVSKDQGRTWSEPRFVFANALAPDRPNAFYNHQCSYIDAIVDREQIHLFVPHRWERVLQLTVRERDLYHLPLKSELLG